MKRLLLLLVLSVISLCRASADDHPRGYYGIPAAAYQAAGESMPGTFLLGGLIFAGNHPINNPVNTGDVGYAELYRMDGNEIVAIDTAEVDTLGYFYFMDLQPGRYIVKAGLSPQSPNYVSYIPTYYGGSTRWNQCDTVELSDHFYTANIHLYHVEITETGFGHIRGFITIPGDPFNDGRVPGCEVVLANAQDLPVGYTFTDANGNFGFERVPAGDYRIWADLAGKYSQKIYRKITSLLPYADSIEIRLSSVMQGISQMSKSETDRISFYPNPVAEKMTLCFTGYNAESYTYAIYSVSGMQVASGTASFDAAMGFKEIDISMLPSGIYYLALRSSSSGEAFCKKVMKK